MSRHHPNDYPDVEQSEILYAYHWTLRRAPLRALPNLTSHGNHFKWGSLRSSKFTLRSDFILNHIYDFWIDSLCDTSVNQPQIEPPVFTHIKAFIFDPLARSFHTQSSSQLQPDT